MSHSRWRPAPPPRSSLRRTASFERGSRASLPGLGAAVEELQELSRGIHPSVLSDAGLGPALESLALRSPIPVALEVRTRERFPQPVEIAAYFAASESLANAAKHSQAERIAVVLRLEGQGLVQSIRDNGIGGADAVRGSGLLGLRDRVEALGGSLEIDSKPGEGTSIAATLPVRDDRSYETHLLEAVRRRASGALVAPLADGGEGSWIASRSRWGVVEGQYLLRGLLDPAAPILRRGGGGVAVADRTVLTVAAPPVP